MKKIILTTVMSAWAALASAQFTNSYTVTPGTAIPDGNPAGIAETFTVSGLFPIQDVQVGLNISGGFNGDLYAYLVAPNGNMAVLLNRVGMDGSNPIGYSDAGFNITLDDGAGANIHNYQSGMYQIIGGQLTGTWASDGRNIDPQSPAISFDSAATSANLESLLASSPNGTWTLFLSDVSSGGGTATLNSATLTVISVPEPQTWALIGVGGLVLLWRNRLMRK